MEYHNSVNSCRSHPSFEPQVLKGDLTNKATHHIVQGLSSIYNADPETSSNPHGDGSTSVLEKPKNDEKRLTDDGGDRDRYAHYVDKRKILKAQLTGGCVVALCGKVWKPKGDPKNHPICPECKRIHDEILHASGDPV